MRDKLLAFVWRAAALGTAALGAAHATLSFTHAHAALGTAALGTAASTHNNAAHWTTPFA